ncbi:hypothetical protein [uncultured Chitinophaga sp.]|uniref:hypothetical protein n=1 Tax=uncultured Chitinophaga sp. TaxID=339340 RepID=UPI0025E3109D|nr:hypothetical protein [uncultured Chitinophaga sp.]
MNFSLYRFRKLFIKQWVENRKLYILATLAIALGMLVLMTGIAFSDDTGLQTGGQDGILVIGLLLCGLAYGSTILKRYHHKAEGIGALMLPASATEKLAVAITYLMLIFPLVYLGVWFLATNTVLTIERNFTRHANHFTSYTFREVLMTFFFVELVLAFVLVCSATFRRYVFPVALSIACAVMFLGVISAEPMMKKLLNNRIPENIAPYLEHFRQEPIGARSYGGTPFKDMQVLIDFRIRDLTSPMVNSSSVSVQLNGGKYVLAMCILFLLPVLLICIAWLKLKEQEL